MTDLELEYELKNQRDPEAWLAATDLMEERGEAECLIRYYRRMGEWGRWLFPVWQELAQLNPNGFMDKPRLLERTHVMHSCFILCRRTPRLIVVQCGHADREGPFGYSLSLPYNSGPMRYHVLVHHARFLTNPAGRSWQHCRKKLYDIVDYFLKVEYLDHLKRISGLIE